MKNSYLYDMCNKLNFHFLYLSVIVSNHLFVDQLIMNSESVRNMSCELNITKLRVSDIVPRFSSAYAKTFRKLFF